MSKDSLYNFIKKLKTPFYVIYNFNHEFENSFSPSHQSLLCMVATASPHLFSTSSYNHMYVLVCMILLWTISIFRITLCCYSDSHFRPFQKGHHKRFLIFLHDEMKAKSNFFSMKSFPPSSFVNLLHSFFVLTMPILSLV